MSVWRRLENHDVLKKWKIRDIVKIQRFDGE
jgi:hypothetical protein